MSKPELSEFSPQHPAPALPAEQALCCIDVSARRGDSLAVAGWCLCSARILAVAVQQDDGSFSEAEFGAERPDVAQAFQEYPNAPRCGFSALTTSHGSELCLRLTLAKPDGGKGWQRDLHRARSR